jgi:transcriptional regulator with XRE-family HTH domain
MSHLTLGERIRRLRLEQKKGKKYSLQELSGRLGDVSKQTLSLIERGKIKNPSTAILNKLAAEFGVTIDFLISGIEGNKENFLQSKGLFSNSIKICRELVGKKNQAGSKHVFLYKKTENLLELFDLICNRLLLHVPGNYDLYTENLSKLNEFIKNIIMIFESEKIDERAVIIVDQTFWRLGKTLREMAVHIDEYGGRHLYPEELKKISELVGEVWSAFSDKKGKIEKKIEFELQGAKLIFIYQGLIDVPGEHWLEFKRRLIFEWELVMQKIENKYKNNN